MSRSHFSTLLLPLVLALSMILIACTTVPDIGRKSFNFIPNTHLNQMGLTEFEKMKSQKRRSGNGTQTAAVNRVAARLKRIVPMPGANWEFVLFEDSTPNAFALPGGKVGVNTGIFKVAHNDAQLAAVLGHELAHVVAGHSGERMSTAVLGSVGIAVLDVALGTRQSTGTRVATSTAASAALGLGMLKFSRGQELEADKLGALYMARAGYNPEESVTLWENFARQKGASSAPAFLRTHPLDSTRIANLRAFMPKALSEYH
jgi:predicted Zn-dependent protease